VEVFDYLNGANNRCGVYSLEMYVDEKLAYSYLMDEFSFSDSRYVNAHLNYEVLARSGVTMHRLYRLPNDRLNAYKTGPGNGVLEISDNLVHQVRIVATDVAGNRTESHFKITGEQRMLPPETPPADFIKHMDYQADNLFENESIRVDIPAYALYRDLDFSFNMVPGPSGALTPYYVIATAEVPLQNPYTLSVPAPGIAPSLRDKLLFITLDEDGETEAGGGQYQNGTITASLNTFGPYALVLDTVAPEIVPQRGSLSGDLTGRKELKFIITDDLSGIKKYEGYIDNNWALFEYDMKNDLLSYKFDGERVSQGSEHELELYVSDEKGNVNLFHTTFTW